MQTYHAIPGLYRSEAVGELMEALAAAQPKFPAIVKERTAEVISKRTGGRYTYAYADLADVLDAVRPALAEHGIALFQCPIEAEGQAGALTVIAKGEQWVGVSMLVPYDPTLGAQGKGSAVTYARRYGLTALLALAARGEDDDAVAATPTVQSAGQKPTPPPPPPPPPPGPTQPDQARGGSLYVTEVKQKPTSKVGITRYEITLSDGRMASTIHQDLAAAAQAFQVERTPVTVELEPTRWGLNLKAIVADEGGVLEFEPPKADDDDPVPF
jgi:hypothetical protein